MKTRSSVCVILCAIICATRGMAQRASAYPASSGGNCARAVLEGEVAAGQSFERVFRPGLSFKLEAIASGWIVRVLPVGAPRDLHDYAELATPPYQSVSPLSISTDFSFRAQDAAGWNPRRFHYAESAAVFTRMQQAYGPAMNGNAGASVELASLAATQPDAEFTLLDTRLVPGVADQVSMAAAVASHFSTTPHEIEQGNGREKLGRLTALRFRVSLAVPAAQRPLPGVQLDLRSCAIHPTMKTGRAS